MLRSVLKGAAEIGMGIYQRNTQPTPHARICGLRQYQGEHFAPAKNDLGKEQLHGR